LRASAWMQGIAVLMPSFQMGANLNNVPLPDC